MAMKPGFGMFNARNGQRERRPQMSLTQKNFLIRRAEQSIHWPWRSLGCKGMSVDSPLIRETKSGRSPSVFRRGPHDDVFLRR